MGFLDYFKDIDTKWFIAGGVILICYVGAKILLWFTDKVVKKFTAKTKTKLDDILVDMMEEPLAFAITIGGGFWAVHYMDFSNVVISNLLYKLLTFIIIIDFTWLIARIFDALLQTYIVPLTEKSASEFDDQLLPIVQKGIRAIVWILGIVLALDNLDIDIGAMIAGLGIGGLALALAAQDSVKNIFGGIMIFLDKPFKINERIQIHGYDGVVEEVGLRSTRIRTLEGRLMIMPNSVFMENEVTNVSSEPSRKVVLSLGMTYDTTPKNMELAMETIREIVKKNEEFILQETPLGFNTFGDFAIGITFIYYIKPGLDNLAIQSKINLDILTYFNERGLEFAFPTQTIYTKNETSS
ncbi:MAG: MscS family membrane protein [Parvicella sp.]|jgi:MscS family membrane protein